MDKIKNDDLFCVKNPHILPLFSPLTYPYEVLPLIKKYLCEFVSTEHEGFHEYAPGVLVGENVRISPFTTIEAPTVICSGSELRPGAYIRGSVFVGENCVIGNSCEIKNSIILDNSQIPHYNYVGDSILGNHAHLGAGCICSNLRIDKADIILKGEEAHVTGLRKIGAFIGDNSECGCNSVLNPGTVLPKGSIVYPLTSVKGILKQ